MSDGIKRGQIELDYGDPGSLRAEDIPYSGENSTKTKIDEKAAGVAEATDNALVRWDGSDGKTLQNSSASCNDDGDIDGAIISASGELRTEAGTIRVKETTTPTATPNYGRVYTKNDNKLYFQDGAGNEHQIGGIKSACSAYLDDETTTVANETYVVVPFDQEDYDDNSDFTTGAAAKFTAPKNMNCHYEIHIVLINLDTAGEYGVYVFKNTDLQKYTKLPTSETTIRLQISGDMKLTLNDYIQVKVWYSAGAGDSINIQGDANAYNTWMMVHEI